ncbi:hypothetical protein J3A84_06435 [Proteiniclasticum sp. SCR006]|uniref:RsgI N-terminal anti-sigma domain-containing protein n=1 Tax=Proteiniclasticum aestuarii TaxID=2817862 RepID=A0A939H9Z6_9CLOT|nr:hypothetical protein [Proteiniclasticum aestuarii]MBO1264663.1 hypothetical protein [Proteiniclasticum aestuarii]
MGKRVLDKQRFVFLEKPAMEVLQREENENRENQIAAYLGELKKYHLSVKKLSEGRPDRKVRNLMLNLAMILISEEKLWEKTRERKRIPLKAFSRMVEVPVFELKEMEDQILAYALLLEGEKYPLIRRSLHFMEGTSEDTTEEASKTSRGLSLLSRGRFSYILTSQGQFQRIRVEEGSSGHVAYGRPIGKRLNLLKPLFALLLAAALLGGVYYTMSRNITQTIIVKATGEVKMDFNSFGDMVQVVGIEATGRKFVEKAQFQEKDIDTVLAEIIEQAYITETIRERAEITILISGAFLPEDFFKAGKTHDRILSYQLNAKINNNGSFLYVE